VSPWIDNWDEYCRANPLPRYQVAGTVTRASAYGVQLDNRPRWWNVSRFAHPPVLLPVAGERVTLTLNHRKYIVAVGPWEDLRPMVDQFKERIDNCTDPAELRIIASELKTRGHEFGYNGYFNLDARIGGKRLQLRGKAREVAQQTT
jgi:hypothetical protein